MIARLTGTVYKELLGEITLDVQGVGYGVSVPADVWESLSEGTEATLFISTYVREDRFDLFGFADRSGKTLFEAFIDMQGIGPKSALELCSVPRSLLLQAIHEQEPKLLTSVKGIGKKTAEKLLVDLESLAEKHPSIFGDTTHQHRKANHFDQDAIDALRILGYDTSTIMNVLQNLPEDLTSTEERVAQALRSM